MIPVHVLTGFLGSGKTTLLKHLLRHPAMGRTAVIVNEFGEVGIDHDLLATGDEHFVQLANGCLCCRVRSDLIETLIDLGARASAAGSSGAARVVIETSGLADPAPILHALMTDRDVRGRYALAEVVTTVDGVLGDTNLERYVESARQVAAADRIVLTKVDRSDARADEVVEAVRAMRPDVRIVRSAQGNVSPSLLFAHGESARREPAWIPLPGAEGDSIRPTVARHTSGMASVAILREQPLRAATLPLFLSALAENLGRDLIRLKGIVAIAEDADRPAVIHGVQHVYEAPVWLPAWPGADRRTRIVCIGRRLNAEWIRTLLDLLDDEVAEEAQRLGANRMHPQR